MTAVTVNLEKTIAALRSLEPDAGSTQKSRIQLAWAIAQVQRVERELRIAAHLLSDEIDPGYALDRMQVALRELTR